MVENQFDPRALLTAGEPCADGSGASRILALVWDDATEAFAGEPATQIVEADLGEIRFTDDGQVFIFAHVGADTDVNSLPLPPRDRFATLANLSPDGLGGLGGLSSLLDE